MMQKTNQNSLFGSFWGSVFLIAGGTIGAGMLALPTVTGEGGVWVSLVAYIVSWLYMVSTGLILFECLSVVNINQSNQKHNQVNLVNTVKSLLGETAKKWVIFSFLGLFSCIMVAYLSKGGDLLLGFLYQLFMLLKIDLSDFLYNSVFSAYLGPVLLAILSHSIICQIYEKIDFWNRVGVIFLFVSFVVLIGISYSAFDSQNLMRSDWSTLPVMVPFMVIAFGFHNMIPSVLKYFKSQDKNAFSNQTVKSIVIGAFIPFFVYLIWNNCVLGVIPAQSSSEFATYFQKGQIITDILADVIRTKNQSSMLNLSFWAQVFSFAAIITSIFGQGVSVVDFVGDFKNALKLKLSRSMISLCFFAFCVMITCFFPGIFLNALGIAGGTFAILLFGIIPCLMCLKARKNKDMQIQYQIFFPQSYVYVLLFLSVIFFMYEILKAFGTFS